jgi:hypothetical protein
VEQAAAFKYCGSGRGFGVDGKVRQEAALRVREGIGDEVKGG